MYDLLSDEAVSALCSNLGILSAGFIFIDPFRQLTRFFAEDGRAEQTYSTRYLWTDGEAGKRWSDAVHRLFVRVRTAQRKHAEDAGIRTEDFFRHIPKESESSYCSGEADQSVRRQHALHYVPLGEMLFTMLAWHSLSTAISRGSGSRGLDEANVGLNDEYESQPSCTWNGVDLLAGERSQSDADESGSLHTAWDTLCSKTLRLGLVWETLNVTQAGTNDHSTEFIAVAQFASKIGAIQNTDHSQLNSQSLNVAIQRYIPLFLQSLGASIQHPTICEAQAALDRYARFPILPFYVWHALDDSPKCYLVSPVWTSQQYFVEVDDAQSKFCYHLGLALSAVLPLRRIDWTLPQDLHVDGGMRCSDADPLVIANVIRLMARPLVEDHVYSSVIRENQESKKERIGALAREVIDGKGDQSTD